MAEKISNFEDDDNIAERSGSSGYAETAINSLKAHLLIKDSLCREKLAGLEISDEAWELLETVDSGIIGRAIENFEDQGVEPKSITALEINSGKTPEKQLMLLGIPKDGTGIISLPLSSWCVSNMEEKDPVNGSNGKNNNGATITFQTSFEAGQWLRQISSEEIKKIAEKFKKMGINTIDAAISKFNKNGKNFAALVFYGRANDGVDEYELLETREVIDINSPVADVEGTDEIKDKYWHKGVANVPRGGGSFEIPAGTILQKRDYGAGESDYVEVKDPVMADVDILDNTNYENIRIVEFGGRSYWMKAAKSSENNPK